MRMRVGREGVLVAQQSDEFRSPYKHWSLLRDEGLIDEHILQKGSFRSDDAIRKLRHKYYPHPEEINQEIKRDTLFWYPEKKEIAGVYLQGRIPPAAQDKALEGLREMKWEDPRRRPETRAGLQRQAEINGVRAQELTVGFTANGSIEKTTPLREQGPAVAKLEPILMAMNEIYSRTLAIYYGEQNRPLSDEEKQRESKKSKLNEWGGIPTNFRLFLTAFSTLALLKSCPSAIHKDGGNARRDQKSFTCLTTVREDDFLGGGEFCLLEYGLRVPVKPGDILVAQTHREWHLNLTPVRGTKYSIVAYYRRHLSNPRMEDNSQV